MNIVTQLNLASLGALKRLGAAVAITAGGGGDNTAVTGIVIDRAAFPQGSMPMSAEMGVVFDAVLAAGKTLSIATVVRDSADGTSFADYQANAAAIAAIGPAGGGAINGEYAVVVNLTSARRFIRLDYTPDLSNTATDTAALRAVGFFGGFDRLPQ